MANNTERIINHEDGVSLKNKIDTITTSLETDRTNIINWSTGTDSEIIEAIRLADAGVLDLERDYGWAVGDERLFHLNENTGTEDYSQKWSAGDIHMVILDKPINVCGCINSRGESVRGNFLIGFKETIVNSYTGTSNDYMPGELVMKYLPEYFDTITKFVSKPTSYNANSANLFKIGISGSKLFMPNTQEFSPIKVDGTVGMLPASNAILLTPRYYQSTINRMKKSCHNGTGSGWELNMTYTSGTTEYPYINSLGQLTSATSRVKSYSFYAII